MVRDEKTGEISVVAGLNADGTPKRTPRKRKTRRVSCNSTDTATCWTTLQELLPAVQGTQPLRFLPHRGRPSRKSLGGDEATAERPRSEQGAACPSQGGHLRLREKGAGRTGNRKTRTSKTGNMEQQKEQQEDPEQTQGKRGYQPIDESKINWQELEDRWGGSVTTLKSPATFEDAPLRQVRLGEGQAHLRRRSIRVGRPPFLQEGRRGKHQPRAALHPQGAETG